MLDKYDATLRPLAFGAIATALILRIIWGIVIPVIPVSDSHAYDVFAQNIAQGLGYAWNPDHPTAYWPVGTSAIYAIFYSAFGHTYKPIVAFQVIVGVAIVVLSMSLARRWFNERTAVTTAWILACWPLLIQYTTLLASELHFLLFLLGAFWLSHLPNRRWFSGVIGAGLALAAASYVRPVALVMVPILFVRDAIARSLRFRVILACIVTTVVMLACILPWSIRNYYVFDQFVLISTNGGANLWMGNNPSESTGYAELPDMTTVNEADRDNLLRQQAIEHIVQNPRAFVTRAAKKFLHLYDRESIGVVWNERGIAKNIGQFMVLPLKAVSSVYWWIILAIATFGAFLFARTNGILLCLVSPPILTWVYFTTVHIITVAGDRYHVPSIPFIAMIAAYALSGRWPTQPRAATRESHLVRGRPR